MSNNCNTGSKEPNDSTMGMPTCEEHAFPEYWNEMVQTSTRHIRDLHGKPRTFGYLYMFLFVLGTGAYLAAVVRQRRRRTLGKSSTSRHTGGKMAPARSPGHWVPSAFELPIPPPNPGWDIKTTSPRPYRPFRYGPKYNVTMGVRSADFHDWIELDNHYPRFYTDKQKRILERGDKCCKTDPLAYDAAIELLEDLVKYLTARYPSLYERTSTGIKNLWSGEELNTTLPLTEDPMQTCARLTQDDLAIMIEKPDGQYYLLAGAILLAGFWRLSDKFGMPLSEIHTSGDVPQYREKLEKGMMNFFRRLKPEDLVARNNYFLQVDEDLAWSHSIGHEDSDGISWNTAEKNRAIEHHYFRSERQTLRRLPKSGGVVFTIRTYFEPVREIAKEPYVPGRLASAVRSWGNDVSRYKGKEKYQDVLLEYLDRKHEEQVRNGLDLEREDDVRAYPW